MNEPQLPRIPRPDAGARITLPYCSRTLQDDLWREFNECSADPIWWNSGRGAQVTDLLEFLARGTR